MEGGERRAGGGGGIREWEAVGLGLGEGREWFI
jgi:hypothetical protein